MESWHYYFLLFLDNEHAHTFLFPYSLVYLLGSSARAHGGMEGSRKSGVGDLRGLENFASITNHRSMKIETFSKMDSYS